MKTTFFGLLALLASPALLAGGNNPWSPFWNHQNQYRLPQNYYPQPYGYNNYRQNSYNNGWMPYSDNNNQWSWGPWDNFNNAWNTVGNSNFEGDGEIDLKIDGWVKIFTDTRANTNNNNQNQLNYRGNQYYRQYNNRDYRNNWFGR